MRQSPGNLQQAIGYTFLDPGLLEQALTHKSHVNELKPRVFKDNERLEFLGDAVLTLLISEHLIQTYPDAPEGNLSKLKAGLVSEASLARVARRLHLGEAIRLGRGEELTEGREKPSILANGLEALIAAVYLDGGLDAARRAVLEAFSSEFQEIRIHGTTVSAQDYKTRLQEWCQRHYDALPQYTVVKQSGPDHEKVFEVQVRVNDQVRGRGVGRSKKEAEQIAARQALIELM